jgi:hypothetical protein
MLWDKLPGVLLEAEFHAVWRDASGARVDVTPKAIPGIDHIFFLPDPALDYKGRQIDNRRVAITGDPTVEEYIVAAEAWFDVLNRGERADMTEVRVSGEDLQVKNRYEHAEGLMLSKYLGDP